MQRLKILTCAFTCCPPGYPGFAGGEDVLGWNLIRQIARFHEVWTIAQEEDRQSIERALTEDEAANLHFLYVDMPKWLHPMLNYQGTHQFYYYLWQVKAYFAARRLSKKIKFDLFQHITYSNDWMVSFIGALLPVPYIRGPGGGAHSTPKGFQREYPLGGRIWEKIRSVGQRLFRMDPLFVKGQRRAKAILVCNAESMDNIPKKWAGKAHMFPINGISSKDLEIVDRMNDEHDGFRVVTAGTLLRIKGFGLGIRAFKSLADRHEDAEFNIVGEGPEEPRLRELVDRLGLQSRVHFLNSLPREEVISTIAASDVFLFPSLRDGGGAVVVEAMSAGKPVVCLDNGGPGMLVTEDSGIKIAPTSPEATVVEFSEALERLYQDKDWRLELGKGARRRAEQEFHWDSLGQRLMEIYRGALNLDDAK
jgi:glycosyltransferase involved in cell wall biosynthesis